MTVYEAISRARSVPATGARAALRTILETRHLYQTVAIEPPKAADCEAAFKLAPRDANLTLERLHQEALRATIGSWNFTFPSTLSLPPRGSADYQPEPIHVIVPTVKLFCDTCDRLEPFNLKSSKSILESEVPNGRGESQVITLLYECQSCKGIPIVFLVRREALRLTLGGRVPMEAVHTPSFIPKSHRKHYQGALVAFQAGQALAGIFLLRTFVEQVCRAAVSDGASTADIVLTAYMDSLPEDFRSRFPSLRDVYGRLSICIHRAQGSSEVFLAALEDIDRHFDARRLFGTPPAI